MPKVACLQFAPGREAVAENWAIIERLCPANVQLTVLPELATSGYLFAEPSDLRRLAEPFPGPSCAFFTGLARRKNTAFLYGFPECDGETLYNSAALVGPEGAIGLYRKAHLFGRETLLFAPGHEEWPVFDLGSLRVGVMICFDWFFPEAARSLALRGADLIAHPSNLILPYCQEAMRTRSIENRLFTATCNRVGSEAIADCSATYTGQSQITDPFGERLTQAPKEGEAVIGAEIDPALARDKRLNSYNDLMADRRPELYRELTH